MPRYVAQPDEAIHQMSSWQKIEVMPFLIVRVASPHLTSQNVRLGPIDASRLPELRLNIRRRWSGPPAFLPKWDRDLPALLGMGTMGFGLSFGGRPAFSLRDYPRIIEIPPPPSRYLLAI